MSLSKKVGGANSRFSSRPSYRYSESIPRSALEPNTWKKVYSNPKTVAKK